MLTLREINQRGSKITYCLFFFCVCVVISAIYAYRERIARHFCLVVDTLCWCDVCAIGFHFGLGVITVLSSEDLRLGESGKWETKDIVHMESNKRKPLC